MCFLGRLSAFATLSFFSLLLIWRPASALNSHIPVDDYNHTMWTAKDGAPGQIQSMAQTPDGWLWLGTVDGLYRYDGVKFERYALAGPLPFPRNRIYRLLAQSNGDLWITYDTGGLSVLHENGRLEDFIVPGSGMDYGLAGLAVDTDGSVWAASQNGIFHYSGGGWSLVQARHGSPLNSDVSLLLDQYGRLWAGDHEGVYLFNRDRAKFEQVAQKEARGSLMLSPDGRLWAADTGAVRLVETPPVVRALPRRPFYTQSSSSWAGQFDRDGNLWRIDCPVGICLVPAAGTSTRPTLIPEKLASAHLDQLWQLGTSSVNAILEDREGDIWIASQASLVRLRENKLFPVHIPGDGTGYSIKQDTDGVVWANDSVTNTLWRLTVDGPPVAQPGHHFREMANDRNGALLLSRRRTIERRYRGHIEQIALPPDRDGKAVDLTVFGILDDGKVLWMMAAETGLMGFSDGKWMPRSAFNLPPKILIPATGGIGQLWLGQVNGNLAFYDNGKLTQYDATMVGLVSGIFPGPEVIVSGEKGTGILKDGTLRMLNAFAPTVLQSISGMAVTQNGDHWFNGSQGIVVVRAQDWKNVAADTRLPLHYKLIGALEGYPGRAALLDRQPTVLDSGNGQLWFRATGGVVRIDYHDVQTNRVQPNVQFLRINTALGSFPAKTGLQLPAGSQAFNIEFTAPGLREPEGMRFQYQLRGVDEQWQTAGPTRTAFYTNVAPGQYHFFLRAVNEDGVFSAEENALQFSITPRAFQTAWFKGLCVIAAAGIALGFYRYRLRKVTSDLTKSMTIRMAERERIARTLHDTILQSVQAIILRLHVMSRDLPIGSAARTALESLLAQADKTVSDGRDQIQELRRAFSSDLPGLVTNSGKALADQYPLMAFELHITGLPSPIRPEICEEIGEIVREAMRNACSHSGGNVIAVNIGYQFGKLALRVTDNGKGIGADVLDGRLRAGHWGLAGMRERASRIGGILDITATPNKGTSVLLCVPIRRSNK
jgi:signal transduction histidine kinase/ligand-binding sensor domain-containing protein